MSKTPVSYRPMVGSGSLVTHLDPERLNHQENLRELDKGLKPDQIRYFNAQPAPNQV